MTHMQFHGGTFVMKENERLSVRDWPQGIQTTTAVQMRRERIIVSLLFNYEEEE